MVEIKLLYFRWLSSFWPTQGPCPPQPVFLLGHAPFQSPLHRIGSPYKYPNNLILVILPAYAVYEDGTDRAF